MRKNCRRVGVLFDVPANAYGDARLARLLRLLRAVPKGSVKKAQRTPLAEGRGLTDGDLEELERQLELDPAF